MVKWSLKYNAGPYLDFDYYVDGRDDKHGVFRYYPTEKRWETVEVAPGDHGLRYSNPIGCKFAREGIEENGALVWF